MWEFESRAHFLDTLQVEAEWSKYRQTTTLLREGISLKTPIIFHKNVKFYILFPNKILAMSFRQIIKKPLKYVYRFTPLIKTRK